MPGLSDRIFGRTGRLAPIPLQVDHYLNGIAVKPMAAEYSSTHTQSFAVEWWTEIRK
jgi:hypothetical protein